MAKISALPPVAAPTGSETVVVLKDGETQRVGVTPLVEAAAAPSIERAGTEADRSEAGALAALLALGDGVYDTVADGLAATPEGDGFYAIDAIGGLSLSKKEGGKAKEMVAFPTRRSMRSNGINLWEVARRGESTDAADMAETTAAINSVMEDAARWGVGLIHCGGRERVYHCGGPYETYGTFDLRAKDRQEVIPFRRGRIRVQSNIELRGASKSSRARFVAAPGDRDPGPLFFTPFYEPSGTGRRENFTTRWIEVDGNMTRQTFSHYAANTSDAHQWMQGHALAGGALKGFLSDECYWHGWWGHAWAGFNGSGDSDEVVTDDWTFIRNVCRDNMQGAGGLDMSNVRSIENRFGGFGGWTAMGLNIEATSGRLKLLDILSMGDFFDGRGGYNSPLATVRDWNGVPGVDTDSPQAVARRVSLRRGMYLSGDYYSDDPFTGQRGRVRIINPTCLQATIGGGGFDRIHVVNPQVDIAYEDTLGIWPPVGEPLHFAYDYEQRTFDQLVIRDAMMRCDVAGPVIKAGNYRKVDISAQITGGRDAGVRLEVCGGRVKVHAENIGTATDRAFWKGIFPGETNEELDARIGSTSAAVVAFGTRGPLEVDVIASDDRGADAQLQYAAYLNVGADAVVGVTGSSDGHLIAPLHDVNDAVFNRGLIGQDKRSYVQRGPLIVDGPIEAKTSLTLDGGDSPVEISLRAGKAQPARISFVQDGGLEGQLVQLADGNMQVQIHEKGSFVGAPIAAANDGTMSFSASWNIPARERETGAYLWVTSDGVWRTSMAKPEAENDGTILGAQGTAAAPVEGS